jgi:ATP-dependent helicase/nuclease subunit A
VNVVPCVLGGAKIADVRRAESAAIASMIATAVRDGSWLVRGDGEARRAATWRDIAVLIPSRAELHTYEEALARAGVPYRHEGGRTFFQRQEVRELIAVLRAIDDPADQVAAVAALRSSAFGVSDEELLLYGGSFNGLRVRRDATGAVPDALRLLGELRQLRHTHALPDIVRTVLDRTRLVEFAMLQPQGEQVAANLLKLIDQARSFTAASGGGLRGFVRWLKENTARTSDETDALISEETDDVVRVVTVHASKGLEFPVVVFANMETEWADRTRVIPDRNGGRLHLRVGKSELKFTTPGWDAALLAERAHDLAEQARLLYVAATRARDRLIVPVFTNAPDARPRAEVKSATDLLRTAGVGEPDGAAIIDPATLPSFPGDLPVWRRALGTASDGAIDRVLSEREAWERERAAALGEAKRPLTIRTASALKPEWEREDAIDAVRRGRATEFGSAVHALLERIDLERPEDAATMAPSVASEFGLAGRDAEIAQVAQRALASEVIARAKRSERVLREVAFTAALPEAAEGLAEGRIDLLFVEDGAIVIVDFKTDSVSASQVVERAAHYHPQALVYAWAAHRATGMPVREVVFLFARPGIEHPVPVDDALLAEAEALLAQPVAAGTEETLAETM